MKKLFLFCVFLICSTYVKAEYVSAFNFSTDTKQIALSTSPATSTRIFNSESFVQRSYIINTSTMNIFVSTFTNSNLTSSTPGVVIIPATPANGVAIPFSFDGPLAPYGGPLFGNANPGGSQITISVVKTK